MGIVGSSGSGKSTLLNVLAGLDLPSAGAAWVNGRNLITMTEEDLVDYRRKEVGFVWQQTGRNLIPYLSAQQNVEIPLVLNGTPRRQAKRRAEELLTAVRLQDKLRSLPQALSGGEQQRISIAVALANGPSLLLADEPTGELSILELTDAPYVYGEDTSLSNLDVLLPPFDALRHPTGHGRAGRIVFTWVS